MKPAPETFIARLVDRRDLSPRVTELTFERDDGAPLRFSPGQWIKAEHNARAGYFSVATAPDRARFAIAVGHTPPWPTALFDGVSVGDTLRMHGPDGHFVRDARDPTPSLFVGHGTGVTPLRSMILAAHAEGSPVAPMALLLGARTEAEALYRDEFEALARDAALAFDLVLSAPEAPWSGALGRVQAHFARAVEALRARAGGAEPSVFVCGAPEMVSAVRQLAADLSIAPEQVHFER